MVAFSKPFRCEVITPTGRVFAGELIAARFPAPDGLVGVLGGRGPLAMLLGAGPLTVRETSGAEAVYFVAGGFARFLDNVLTLLPQECEALDQIDSEEAWREIEAAQKLPRETPEQRRRRDDALHAARTKFSMAQKFRKDMDEL